MRFPRRALAIGGILLAADLVLGSAGAPATAPGRLRTGISYGDTLVWMPAGRLASALDDAVRVGATWVRADLSWSDIQYDGPDRFRWDLFDRVVLAARARRLTVLPVLAYTPPWARPAGCGLPVCAPADPTAFAAFARAAARRYQPLGIHTWEIWNEPNIGFWQPAPDPRAYLALLAATASAIRSADPGARLVLGGLAATAPGPGRITQSDFLSEVARLGGNRMVDAVGYHPYTYPHLPSDRTGFGTAWEQMDTLRGILAEYGTPELPVWVTEFGAPTGGPGGTHVTEARQAQIAADVIATAAADRHVAAVFWYSDRDLTADPATNENFYGLRRADGSPKPALAALRDAIRSMPRIR